MATYFPGIDFHFRLRDIASYLRSLPNGFSNKIKTQLSMQNHPWPLINMYFTVHVNCFLNNHKDTGGNGSSVGDLPPSIVKQVYVRFIMPMGYSSMSLAAPKDTATLLIRANTACPAFSFNSKKDWRGIRAHRRQPISKRRSTKDSPWSIIRTTLNK